MRNAFEEQRRFGCQPISDIVLNVNCRDEIIPVLTALQHVYSQADLRDAILALIAADVNQDSRNDCGREGLGYWQILVLAAVRLGCNFDYDRWCRRRLHWDVAIARAPLSSVAHSGCI